MTTHPSHQSIEVAKAYARGTVQIKLIAVDVTLSQLEIGFERDKVLSAHLAKIRKWCARCWESTGCSPLKPVTNKETGRVEWLPAGRAKRKLSAAVARRADTETATIDAARVDVIGKLSSIESWAAWLVALDAMIDDAWRLWSGKAACWRYFAQTWDTLTRIFLAQCEDQESVEANGADIFEGIMERTGWE